MGYSAIIKETSITLDHAYSLSYFDHRGRVVKELKKFLPYVNTKTDKNEKIILSSTFGIDESTIQGFFSPDSMGLRTLSTENIDIFYSNAQDWIHIIADKLGLMGYFDDFWVSTKVEIEFDTLEDYKNLLNTMGFYQEIENSRSIVSLDFNALYSVDGEDDRLLFLLKLDENEDPDNDNYIFELTSFFKSPKENTDLDQEFIKNCIELVHEELLNLHILQRREE